MSTPSDIYLLWGDGSPPCMSVLITLEEKQLQGYRQKCLSFDKEEYRLPEVVKLNPRAELPTCKIGDLVLNESLAICQYLIEKNPGKGPELIPSNAEQKAMMWQRISEFYWNLPRRCYKDYIKYLWTTPTAERDPNLLDPKRKEFIKEVTLWEGYLKETSKAGPYIIGEQYTLADIIIFPWLAFLVALSLDLQASGLNHLKNYCDNMMTKQSVKETFPKRWDGSIDTMVLKDMHLYFTSSK